MADKRIFLGVKQSATGLCWEHRLTERQEMIALTIAQSHGVPDIVARVLAGRGVMPEETERFLDPTIRNLLPDPASLTDMDRAAERIAQAIRNREKVAIFGDYDVDGALLVPQSTVTISLAPRLASSRIASGLGP